MKLQYPPSILHLKKTKHCKKYFSKTKKCVELQWCDLEMSRTYFSDISIHVKDYVFIFNFSELHVIFTKDLINKTL